MHLSGDQTPAWARITGRSLLWLVLGVYFFVVYGISRGLIADFGVSLWVVARAAMATILMGGFVVWLILFTEVPEMICEHALPRRRAARRRCHACNHRSEGGASVLCQECGADHADIPKPYTLSWRTVRRFGLILFLSLTAGVTVGELWISADENRIRSSVSAMISDSILQTTHFQPHGQELTVIDFRRIWPADFSHITWSAESGFQSIPTLRPLKFRDLEHESTQVR